MASAGTEILQRGIHLDIYSGLDRNAAQFGSCESPRILSILSSLLERMVARNDTHQGLSSQRLTVFHGLKAPSISVDKYVERIFKYANCSPACFVVAYAYLDRFIHQQSGLPITSLNVHRLLITSVMVAAKFLDDAYYNNAYYAKVGGVNTQEMNRLELEFLFRLGFRLHVTVQVFEGYCSHLEKEVALTGGYQVDRSNLQPNCGLNGSSAQDKAEKQVITERCNYVAINALESVS